MSVISAENKRALQILRLVTEQVEDLAATKLQNLELIDRCADIADRYSYEAAQAIRRLALC